MRSLIIILLVFLVQQKVTAQSNMPDLNDPDDLKQLGAGRLIERDNHILKNITLEEINEFWIIYLKDNSLHEMVMENIDRIEFPESKWGPLKMRFPGNKPQLLEMLN